MDASARQEVQPLDEERDVVLELEQIVRRLRATDGNWTLEAIFDGGSYVRGFIKRGPISREQMRELGRLP